MTKTDTLLLVLMNLIWGSTYAVAGTGMKSFAPVFLFAIRFLISGGISIFFNKFPKEDILKILTLSFWTTITFYGIAVGVKHLDSSTSSILVQLDVAWTIILTYIFFNEKISFITVSSVVLCFIGMFVIKGGISVENTKYFILVVISSLASAMINITTKSIKNTSNQSITAWNSICVGVELFIISLLTERKFIVNPLNYKAILSLLYISIFSTYVAYYIMYYLFRKYPASKIVPYNFSKIIIALFAGIIILNETITSRKLIGTILLLIGMYMSQLEKNKKKKQ